MISSYEIGSILGRANAGAWQRARKPFSASKAESAAKSYFEAASLAFVNLSKQDFIEGFLDGVEASFKGQLAKPTRCATSC